MGRDDGCTPKAIRGERHQAESEASAQGVADDLFDARRQGAQDVFDGVLEGPNVCRVGAMSGQVDGDPAITETPTTGPPIFAAARKPVQQQDQSVASAMRASRSLSRSIKA